MKPHYAVVILEPLFEATTKMIISSELTLSDMRRSRKFFRGGPTCFFLVNEWIQIQLRLGLHRPDGEHHFNGVSSAH